MIIYDNREKSMIPMLLSLRAETKAAQLPVGDYVVSDRLAIERKSAADFAQSLMDGRLFEQASRLMESFQRGVMIVQGTPKLKPEVFQGALASLIRRGIAVVLTQDDEETVDWIVLLAKQENKPGKAQGVRKKSLDPDKTAEYILATVPGISLNTAKELLMQFGSLRSVLEASARELQSVPGIGKKRAEAISALFVHAYKT